MGTVHPDGGREGHRLRGRRWAPDRGLDDSHIASHLGLVRRPFRYPPGLLPLAGGSDDRFDAIIVPAARTGIHLQSAAAVARRAGRVLLVLCSRDCTLDDAARGIADSNPGTDVFLVDAGDLKPLTQFASDEFMTTVAPWPCDTSAKRNAGLALARAMGWRSALFMDDDVRELRTADLRRALIALRSRRVVGWTFPAFPDNSVVCHAYRRLPGPPLYGRQGTFIGGGGLALRLDGDVPFFPTTYNEDWLFLYPFLKSDAVSLMGRLHQRSYDPFESPGTAARQEFGDVLGEGLFRLLHGHRAGRWDPDERALAVDYWEDAIERREHFVDHLIRKWAAMGPSTARIVGCLEESRRTLGTVSASALAKYVACWLNDQRAWTQALDRLPACDRGPVGERINRALEFLGLPAAAPLERATAVRASRFPRRKPVVPRPRTGLAAEGDLGTDIGLAVEHTTPVDQAVA